MLFKLIKPAILLALGVILSYPCADYIFNSEQFDEYMDYMLKDYENPSAAMVGLVPIFIVFFNLVASVTVHLFAILLYKLLKSSFISSVIKKITLVICTLVFLGFCTITFISLTNVYEGYLIPTLIPKIFWIGYSFYLLLIYFRSQYIFYLP